MRRIVGISLNAKDIIRVFYVGLRFLIKVDRNIGITKHGRKKRDRSDGGGFVLFIVNIDGR
jgi:hypothetical protein